MSVFDTAGQWTMLQGVLQMLRFRYQIVDVQGDGPNKTESVLSSGDAALDPARMAIAEGFSKPAGVRPDGTPVKAKSYTPREGTLKAALFGGDGSFMSWTPVTDDTEIGLVGKIGLRPLATATEAKAKGRKSLPRL